MCDCREELTITKIKVEEKGKQAIFLNPDKEIFYRVRIDKCIVKEQTACDWMVEKKEYGGVLIELKGCDVSHAIDQIEAAFIILKTRKILPPKSAALIICKNPPSHPSFTTKLQRTKNKLLKSYKAPLHVITGNHEMVFENLFRCSNPLGKS